MEEVAGRAARSISAVLWIAYRWWQRPPAANNLVDKKQLRRLEGDLLVEPKPYSQFSCPALNAAVKNCTFDFAMAAKNVEFSVLGTDELR
jgi:hypothetical protein